MPNESVWKAKVGGCNSENGGPFLLGRLPHCLFPTLCRPGLGREKEDISLWRLLLHFTSFDPHSHSMRYFTVFSILNMDNLEFRELLSFLFGCLVWFGLVWFGFRLHRAVCGILVPRPGIEPVPPALGMQSLHPWTAREVP